MQLCGLALGNQLLKKETKSMSDERKNKLDFDEIKNLCFERQREESEKTIHEMEECICTQNKEHLKSTNKKTNNRCF